MTSRTGAVTSTTLAALLVGAGGLVSPAVAVSPALVPSTVRGAEPANTDGWWYRVMGLAKVHREVTGKGVTIALIDSGIDPAFKDLQGAHIVMKDRCLESGRSRPQSGSYGWHGDSMASYLVGTGRGNGPGGAGVRGVAPDATVNFYQTNTVVERPPEQPHDECNGYGLAVLIDQAVRDGADIVSVSLTAGGPPLRRAAQRAARRGVVVVAATGDSSDPTLRPEERPYAFGAPAAYPGVVAVYAADSQARPWVNNPLPKTKYGAHAYPTITAPGVDIVTPYYKPGVGWSSVGKTDSGTSPATAIVAGSLALVKSKYPDATANQLIQSLIHDTGGSSTYGYHARFGFGIVSVPSMLAHDPRKWPDVNPLLHGPAAAVRDFPVSSYGKAASGTNDEAGATRTAPKATSTGSGSATKRAAPRNNGASDSRGGLPGWTWPVLLALAAALALGGALVLGRHRLRGRPRTEQEGVAQQDPVSTSVSGRGEGA